MTELEKAMDLLDKAHEFNGLEPDKCLIYIERARQELRRYIDKEEEEVPF